MLSRLPSRLPSRARFLSTVAATPFPAGGNFTSISALEPGQLRSLLDESHALKALYRPSAPSATPPPQPRAGTAGARIGPKGAPRTRVSTETGVTMLGGHPLFLAPTDIQLGVNESVRDTASVLSRFNDVILARVGHTSTIEELCEHSTKPVINALCNKYHPLQTLADLMTLEEKWGRGGVDGRTISWVGDGNNIIHDLMVGGAMLGASVRVATPPGYECAPDVVERTREVLHGGRELKLTPDASVACEGADVIVTDTWVSMGEEDQ
jgi:ornithine carbamoyltransferase